MTVQFIVPWADYGCEHRRAALTYVGAHLSEHHGGYALAELNADQPWSKGAAIAEWDVMANLRGDHERTDMYAITDADVIVDPAAVSAAIEVVAAGRAQWAMPHRQVWRLDRASTTALLAGELSGARRYERRYQGVEGGGMVVIAADLYRQAPFDTRMVGWGGEDLAAGIAWRTLAGPPWRGQAPLVHLWHPPQPKLTPAVGSRANHLLLGEYRKVAGDPSRMRDVIHGQDEASTHALRL